ncbi:LacI family DNA-binding transcriptional regulator [Hoeflea sp. YIM 152468]|uniref:LacI family DNA-binding transcriptional regulator n=1 Tax=Hoeflea sp. YIM 152468 TaxID=3031759 RepID=UPI0023DC355B|nr:LacI family DNA-binding transcriptional regulator [Hoeflea sp. YIM 152468]MDF1610135.1 LacI family DNA-binding transcriptional regulator [Hoeflea sp. YIM 152468]
MNLKQLSELLELSQTTVSRALNGYPEVNEKTRRRVLEAAQQHGYKPNSNARKLATGRAGSIGYVLPVGRNVDLDPHFVEFLSGMGEHAMMRDVDLSLTPASYERESEAYRRIAASRSVDGVYLSSMRSDEKRIGLVRELRLPFLAHGRAQLPSDGYACVDIDNEGAFHDAARLLLQLGHQRLAYINGDMEFAFAVHRLNGVKRAMAAYGVPMDRLAHHSAAMNEENGYRIAMTLFGETSPATRPTGVLSASMFTTLGVVRALTHLGLSLPDDVSIITHDDVFPFLKPERFSVPLTTTRSSIRAAGARICERLVDIISGVETDPVQEIWPVELIVRASTGPAPAERRIVRKRPAEAAE